MNWYEIAYIATLKIIILVLLVERYKLKRANKFYRQYIAKQCVEMAANNKLLAQIMKDVA